MMPVRADRLTGLRDVRTWAGIRFPALADFLWNARFLFKKDKSQFGEASLLDRHLPREGLYLELGCYQPVMYSNTWRLARHGWRGWSVDPEPALEKQWRIFRPRSTFIQSAVTWSPEVTSVEFFRFPRDIAVLNTVSADVASSKVASTGRGYSKLTVEAKFLPALIESFVERWGRSPTLLAMDCEGVDPELIQCILTDVPATIWPAFLLVEGPVPDIEQLLVPAGWQRLGTVGPSSLFSLRSAHDT
jgi:hypothetical protein